ncbi:hypothetical protein BU23DRAFT_566975 [Bimuria novae-zelandiae CBS 107.79]|uniref:Uncharacterized protein n=1 Tax=Bimuria novae-zelandiae CBS 107.79 TaxID=1447943 RepID=A0A6A5VD10_9PLEO|nr:hypothetical protein BU23DRAFT_566975 [Bimuria novae-zelandiae CBS 107.79]
MYKTSAGYHSRAHDRPARLRLSTRGPQPRRHLAPKRNLHLQRRTVPRAANEREVPSYGAQIYSEGVAGEEETSDEYTCRISTSNSFSHRQHATVPIYYMKEAILSNAYAIWPHITYDSIDLIKVKNPATTQAAVIYYTGLEWELIIEGARCEDTGAATEVLFE